MATGQFEVVAKAAPTAGQSVGQISFFDENGDPVTVGAPTTAQVSDALKAKSQIAALTADLVPAEATVAECATKINAIITALKA